MGKQEEGWVCREDAEARLARGWRRWERSREAQSRRQSRREGSSLNSWHQWCAAPLAKKGPGVSEEYSIPPE